MKLESCLEQSEQNWREAPREELEDPLHPQAAYARTSSEMSQLQKLCPLPWGERPTRGTRCRSCPETRLSSRFILLGTGGTAPRSHLSTGLLSLSPSARPMPVDGPRCRPPLLPHKRIHCRFPSWVPRSMKDGSM